MRIISKRGKANVEIDLCYNWVITYVSNNVKLLGIKLDNELNFDPHITDLCKKAATQLSVRKRLKSFIGLEERKTLVESFIYSNINYSRLVWHFSSAKSAQKVEKIQERAWRFLY